MLKKWNTGLVVLAVAAIIYGGSKPSPSPSGGRITVDSTYLIDTGSYLTNDTCHVAVQRTSLLVPLDAHVLVHAREIGSDAEWIRLLPELTIADHPHDYALPNATNYNVMVTCDYVPPSPVVTNKLLVISALIAQGWQPILPESKIVVPQLQLELERKETGNE